MLKEVRDRALENPEENKRLLMCEWSADVDSVGWDSVDAVQRSNPSLGWFQSWDWIREVDLRSMTEEAYKRERLGAWADVLSDAAIGVDLWAQSFATEEALLGRRLCVDRLLWRSRRIVIWRCWLVLLS